jgi:hypothetical protein
LEADAPEDAEMQHCIQLLQNQMRELKLDANSPMSTSSWLEPDTKQPRLAMTPEDVDAEINSAPGYFCFDYLEAFDEQRVASEIADQGMVSQEEIDTRRREVRATQRSKSEPGKPPLVSRQNGLEDGPRQAQWRERLRACRHVQVRRSVRRLEFGNSPADRSRSPAREDLEQDLLTLPTESKASAKPSTKSPMKTATKIGGRRLRMARGITVDTGAADNVMPRRMIRGRGNKIRSSAASRKGVHYVSACATRIPNEGEADMKFATADDQDLCWTFQIAEVNKVLASVSYLVDRRHRVTFDQDYATGEDLSFIQNKVTNEIIKMRRTNNVWVIDAFVEEDGELFVRPE